MILLLQKRLDLPIPRVQTGPSPETALETPNERHDVSICLIFQGLPSRVTEAISRIARYESLAVHFELIGVVGVEVDAGNEVVEVTGHLC